MGEQYSLNNWLTFAEARQVVRDEDIGSVTQYKRWHDNNRPRQIPKYPYNVWKKEWTNWNDYLGNDNEFKHPHKIKFRPYKEAVAFVHALHLPKKTEWIKYCKEVGLPKDVPARPDLVYDTWVSWYHWLGNKTSTRISAAQDSAKIAILYVAQLKGRPANVFRIGAVAGKAALLDSQKANGFKIVKVFQLDEGYDWKKAVSSHGTTWWEGEGDEYVIANIHELMFDLSNDLLLA